MGTFSDKLFFLIHSFLILLSSAFALLNKLPLSFHPWRMSLLWLFLPVVAPSSRCGYQLIGQTRAILCLLGTTHLGLGSIQPLVQSNHPGCLQQHNHHTYLWISHFVLSFGVRLDDELPSGGNSLRPTLIGSRPLFTSHFGPYYTVTSLRCPSSRSHPTGNRGLRGTTCILLGGSLRLSPDKTSPYGAVPYARLHDLFPSQRRPLNHWRRRPLQAASYARQSWTGFSLPVGPPTQQYCLGFASYQVDFGGGSLFPQPTDWWI